MLPLRAMATPPPDGVSPWPQDLPSGGSSAGRPRVNGSKARSGSRRGTATPRTLATPWLWLPLALSSMLLVLFVVVVTRQQAQAQRIGELLSRVQTLEHSRALERTAVLEQQLRSMLTRLQELEKQNKQNELVVRQLQSLQQELQLLRSAAGSSVDDPVREPTPLPDPPAGRSPRAATVTSPMP